jgi:hypothetical protein
MLRLPVDLIKLLSEIATAYVAVYTGVFLLKGNVMAIAALSSGVTGLNAAERALGNSAHAIANIGTQGFQPSQALCSPKRPRPAPASRFPCAASNCCSGRAQCHQPCHRNHQLTGHKAQFDLSAKVIQAADQNLGTLIDIKA